MILDNDVQDVQVQGANNVSEFTIKASAKAFQILSSNLYSNPLGAMIRELSTNAYDAHVMVDKKDKPFKIKLPNALDPTFKIRDFGPGLSDEDIHQVYTTFFESTKTNSNDVVGCLGLGSKSPFGVSDSFTIISYHGGTKTIYSAFLNSQRIPNIAHFYQEDSDEPTGIEIEVAIKKEDVNYFTQETENQLKYFKVKPDIEGNPIEWEEPDEIVFEGKNWKITKGSTGYRSDSVKVIQGQISYPIDTSSLGTKYQEAKTNIQQIFRLPLIIDVNIGDVNIAPSREALTYDEKTVDFLMDIAEQIFESLPNTINDEMESQETEYLARIKYGEISRAFHYTISDILKNQIFWNDIDITNNTIKIDESEFAQIRMYDYHGSRLSSRLLGLNIDWSASTTHSSKRNWTINCSLNNHFLYCLDGVDSTRAITSKVKKYMVDNNLSANQNVLLITTDKSLKQTQSLLGNPKMIDTADLEKMKIMKKTKSDKITIHTINTYSWSAKNSFDAKHMTIEELEELEGYYLPADGYDIVVNYKGINTNIKEIREIISLAEALNIIDSTETVYALRKRNMQRKHKMKSLVQAIYEKMIPYVEETIEPVIKNCNSTTMVRILNHPIETLERIQNETTGPLSEVIESVVKSRQHDSNKILSRYSHIINLFKIVEVSNVMNVNDKIKLIENQYPMIAETNYYIDNMDVLLEYINQMDLIASMQCNINYTPITAFIESFKIQEEHEEEVSEI